MCSNVRQTVAELHKKSVEAMEKNLLDKENEIRSLIERQERADDERRKLLDTVDELNIMLESGNREVEWGATPGEETARHLSTANQSMSGHIEGLVKEKQQLFNTLRSLGEAAYSDSSSFERISEGSEDADNLVSL